MDWLVSFVWSLITSVISILCPYVVWPLVTFATWYFVYALGVLLLRVLLKTRYEVFNEDLKYTRAECQKRVVLITGATSGIGLAAAHHFYSRGFVIIACFYSRDEPGYNELSSLIGPQMGAMQPSMYLVKLDVTSGESIEECYKQVKVILSNNPKLQLHALLNVAGIACFHKFQWTSRDLIRRVVETNLLGPMLMTRQFLHLLNTSPGSRVVNVASPLAIFPLEYNAIYGATKAGLTSFTNSLELDLMRYGVATSTIHPGNLMRNTAVLDATLDSKLDPITPQLNEDERKLYKAELDEHLIRMNYIEKVIKRPQSIRLSQSKSIKSNLARLAMISSGSIEETKPNENASVMQSFDNSIRLRSPPKEIFAGNILFNLLSGSVLDWLSRAACRDISLILQRNGLGSIL